MNKTTFQAAFPPAKYQARTNTFYVDSSLYSQARQFVKHKFATFKIVQS